MRAQSPPAALFFVWGPPPREPTVAAALVGACLFSGWMLSPDLDLHSSIYQRWGPLRFLWWPYQKLVPHRSWLSHSWFLGPVLRTAYFLLMAWLLSHVVVWALGQSGLARTRPLANPIDLVRDLWLVYPDHTLWGALGLFLGAGLHTGADAIWTFIKKTF